MHAAWRKRAEESEATEARYKALLGRCVGVVKEGAGLNGLYGFQERCQALLADLEEFKEPPDA